MNIDEPLTRIKGTTIRHYVTDALGSVIGMADDTGAMKTTYTYDPFGNTTVSGEASDNPFQYTGRENDGTALYYYRARYYSPDLQRFISEDPIGCYGGNTNFYLYTNNNPINHMDPTGLITCNGKWRIQHWDYSLPIIMRRCTCYWLCVPCDGSTVWSGNPYGLPKTKGFIAYTGRDIEMGDTCFCDKPGPEKDCNKCEI